MELPPASPGGDKSVLGRVEAEPTEEQQDKPLATIDNGEGRKHEASQDRKRKVIEAKPQSEDETQRKKLKQQKLPFKMVTKHD